MSLNPTLPLELDLFVEKLKQTFRPGFRLWFINQIIVNEQTGLCLSMWDEILPESFDRLDSLEEDAFRKYAEKTLKALTEKTLWLTFIDIIESMLQVALSGKDTRSFADAFASQLVEGLHLTSQGFLYYNGEAARSFFTKEQPIKTPSALNKLSDVDTRKSQFQNIRKKRLRLLAQWESL